MNDEIYLLMTGFLEKQDLLNQVFHPENLSGYGTTELHVLKAIHELESPNVTTLAKALGLTKGAISKTIRKLMDKFLSRLSEEELRNAAHYLRQYNEFLEQIIQRELN